MNEQQHVDNPTRPEAWGDVQMPQAADERQWKLERTGPPESVAGDPPPARAQSNGPRQESPPSPDLREDTGAYGFGVTTSSPAIGPGYTHQPPGPGNEALVGGESPAPRSYTGGAMGKYIAGLSPSFPQAAEGDPPPGGPAIYTPAEAQTTFTSTAGIAPPLAAHGVGLSPQEDLPSRAGDTTAGQQDMPEPPQRLA
jgi:hypothetical protein